MMIRESDRRGRLSHPLFINAAGSPAAFFILQHAGLGSGSSILELPRLFKSCFIVIGFILVTKEF